MEYAANSDSPRNYRVLFVDDEAIVREGISTRIDWGELGFDLVTCLENGEEALEYLRDENVDLVISDINMPRMDGLALSRRIYERFPRIRVILLTGYDEFEYAQEALNNHVRRFLLKPITADELSHVLSQTREELDQLRRSEQQQIALRERLVKSLPVMRERYFNSLVHGRMTPEQIRMSGEELEISLTKPFFQAVIVSVDDDWKEIEILELTDIAESLLGDGEYAFRTPENKIAVLFQGEREEMLDNSARMFADQLFKSSLVIRENRVLIGIGSVGEGLVSIQASFLSASTAVNYSRALGVNRIFSMSELQKRDRLSPEIFHKRLSSMTMSLQTGNHSETKREIDDLFALFGNHFIKPDELGFYIEQLYIRLQECVGELGSLTGSTASETGREDEGSGVIPPRVFTSVSDAESFVREAVDLYEQALENLRKSTLETRISRAVEIIEQRIGDKNFGLADICNELYLSVSQFSLIFKEGTGKTFLEYLTERRIEAAKKLLKSSDMKGYKIAEAVGFSDPRYFSIVFKKHCGMTAMQYRSSRSE
jgi:two-component system response regulator YesN